MSLALYFDENVPSQIAAGLRRRGIDVLAVQEDHRSGRPDSEILDRAATLARLMFTMDDDFLAETTRRLRGGESFVGIVYAHQQHVSIGRCVNDLELIASACELAEYANRVQYLPL